MSVLAYYNLPFAVRIVVNPETMLSSELEINVIRPDQTCGDLLFFGVEHGTDLIMARHEVYFKWKGRAARVAVVLFQAWGLSWHRADAERPEQSRDCEEDFLLCDGHTGAYTATNGEVNARWLAACEPTYPAPKAQWSLSIGFDCFEDSALERVSSMKRSGLNSNLPRT